MHKLFSCAQSQYSLDFGLFYLFVLHNLKSYPHVHNVFHRLAKFLPKVHPEYAIIWIRENNDKGGLLMENDVLSSLWETLLNGDQSIPKMSGCKKWLSQAVPRSLTEDTLLLDVMNDFTKHKGEIFPFPNINDLYTEKNLFFSPFPFRFPHLLCDTKSSYKNRISYQNVVSVHFTKTRP